MCSSYSKPGESLILFQLKDATSAASVPDAWYAVRKRVSDMAASLPAGVRGPFFNDEFGDVYGVIYALQTDGFDYSDLKTFADEVRQQLLRVKDVNKVELFGVQDERIYVEVSQKRLAQLGLDMGQVLAQLNHKNAVEGAAVVQTPLDAVQVRIAGQFGSLAQLRDMSIRGRSGSMLRLSDIASVTRGYVDPPQVLVHHQGKPVIALGVSMAKGGDIIALGRALGVATQRIESRLPAGLRLIQLQDQPRSVANSVNEFVKVLIEAILIVLVVSFVSLGLHRRAGVPPWYWRYYIDMRPGLIVGITIPLVLAVTFIGMPYWGICLHKISMGSLIIALGLLVDDAMIAVEMMVRKLEEGYDRIRAATFAYEITAMPMLTGTLITAAGFLPIGIARSVTGEYTFAIFAVTVLALVVSWVVSVFFVPYLGTLLLKTPSHQRETQAFSPDSDLPLQHADKVEVAQVGTASMLDPDAGSRATIPHGSFDSPFYNRFRVVLRWCVQHRWITIGLTLLILLTFALGLAGMGQVQQQFFPDSSRPEIMLDLWFAEGTSIAANEAVTRRVEQRLMAEPGINSVSTWIGSGVPRFYLPIDQIFPQSNVSQLIVVPKDLKLREALRNRLPTLMAREFPEAAGSGQIARQWPAGGVSGSISGGRPGAVPAARVCRRGQGSDAREPRHAWRQ